MMGYDVIFTVSGVLGSLGALTILLVHFCVPSTRTTSRITLLYLSLCDLGQGLYFALYLGEWISIPSVCVIHHLWGVFTASASFYWTACTALHILYGLQKPGKVLPSFYCHLFAWGLPIISLVPYSTYTIYYVKEANRGWFCCLQVNNLWQLLLEYYCPLITCWMITCIGFIASQWEIYKLLQSNTNEEDSMSLKYKFLMIPVIFLLLRVWSVIDLTRLLLGLPIPMWLMYFRAIGDPSQGFFNAIVFVLMTKKIRQQVLDKLSSPKTEHISFRSKSFCYGTADNTISRHTHNTTALSVSL
eukprot:NODE_3137_length_1415_cov_35.925697_g2726_i0.p1 GENE.NODE_3137_length_1415_cov_35.925697_g2726_i0~~NODE_3137_length_1415_cov_35.925697_g2726_i0.p1  ORF type:complete len:301 (-),score=19.30 NODE_3137_length_1415_cov_35.925697_g2726_i0:450-1352(-)